MSFSSGRSSRFLSRIPVQLPVAAVLLAAAGCSPGSSGTVAVPSPAPAQAAMCRALHSELPHTVDGQARRSATPASDFTAVWGDPAIVLRCGVPRPAVLAPGNPKYQPNAQAMGIDGVDWLPEKQSDGSVRCTTTLRKAFVEVTIPAKYVGPYGDISMLTDLAPAVARTIPAGI